MPISDLLTTKLVTIKTSQTLREIEPMVARHRIHNLLVMEGVRLVGLVTDRDLFRNLSPFVHTQVADERDAFLLERTAGQIMNKQLVIIEPHAGIRDACRLMLEEAVSLLPVVEDGKLVGVVSWKDILRYFLD